MSNYVYKRKINDTNRNEGLNELRHLYEVVVDLQVGSEEWNKTNERISLLERQLELYDKEMNYD